MDMFIAIAAGIAGIIGLFYFLSDADDDAAGVNRGRPGKH